MHYRRYRKAGGRFFFTVNLQDRQQDYLTRHIHLLRDSFRLVKARHPFIINAIVILPDHLHTIWTLPEGDDNYAMRWSLIKTHFSRKLPLQEVRSASRVKRRERGIWQRRFWEHCIRDDDDMNHHINYIHNNPVKHGYVTDAKLWPHIGIHPNVGCAE